MSLFTVRRQLRFHFDHEDLREHRIELADADVAAGPLACSSEVDGYFRPILAGGRAGVVSGADPYDHGHPVGTVCTPLDSYGNYSGSPAYPSAGATTGSAPTATPGTTHGKAPTGTPGPAGGPRADGTSPAGLRTSDATPRLPARPLTYPGPAHPWSPPRAR